MRSPVLAALAVHSTSTCCRWRTVYFACWLGWAATFRSRPLLRIAALPKIFAKHRSVVERTIRRLKQVERLGGSSTYFRQQAVMENAIQLVCCIVNDESISGRLHLVSEADDAEEEEEG